MSEMIRKAFDDLIERIAATQAVILADWKRLEEQTAAAGDHMIPVPETIAPAPEWGWDDMDNPIHDGRRLPWGKQALESYGEEFIEGLLWIEANNGPKPELLLPCMKFESNINHKARNPVSSASGLIQFMSFTARNLGTDIQTIRNMDAMGQLSYVYKYFDDFNKRGFKISSWDIADLYMSILWPKAIGKPMNYVLWNRGTTAYRQNRGLDTDRNGNVTKAEAAGKIIRLEKEGYLPENVLVID